MKRAEIDEFCKIGKFNKSHQTDWTVLNLSLQDGERYKQAVLEI